MIRTALITKTTKKIIYIALLLCVFISNGQYSQSKIDCNTLFVCIPAEDYTALFSNSFVKDTLFFCREESTKTNIDDYTGKYFIGEFATLEFLKPSDKNKFGDYLNDIGIEFKSRNIGILDSLKNSNSNVDIEKVYIESDTEKYLWYDSLKLKKNKTNLEFYILEYSAEYLKQLGFSETQLLEDISPSKYNEIVYKNKAYPRKFKSFKSISIEVDSKGKKYLKQIAQQFKFKFYENFIDCKDFTIYYKLNKKIKNTILKNIEVNLTEPLSNKEIVLSKTITISISNKNAKIIFKK